MDSPSSRAAELATTLEQITLDLLMSEGDGSSAARCTSSLAALAQRARDIHHQQAAAVADRLVRRLLADPSAVNDLDADFQELRATIEAAASGASEVAVVPQPPIPIAQDPELINDFVVESKEHLDSIEGRLLDVEHNPANTEAIHSIFRSFHTIKGLAGFLELSLVKAVAHEVETVLDQAREGRLAIDGRAIDVVLESKDYIGRWLKHLENGPSTVVPQDLADVDGLIGRVHHLMQSTEPAQPAVPHGLPVPHLAPVRYPAEPAGAVPRSDSAGMVQQERGSTGSNGARAAAGRSVKVDTAKLDYLVDMVGEMVIAQSLVRHDPDLAELDNERLGRSLAQLARITDEVQRTAMAMRMVPIGPLFQKMARLVRDLSRKFDKQVNFESSGEDVEIDRNIVEELADPLMHMVRNAVDHGIETPDQRRQSGKPPVASVALRAYHRSGQIVIEIADDGRGINRQKILEKARANGVVAGATPPDSEILELIFHPGLSTAEKVSDVSGRGVGMDVVRKHIQKLRGTVDIQSVEGAGTTFALQLPLTLAIIDGLVVTAGTERYIVPLSSVKEMLRPAPGMVNSIENRAEVVSIRDALYPLVRLYERFGIQPRTTEPTEAVVVVIDHDGKSFCIMVDELVGKQEVVIKSLGPMFSRVAGIAGGAILGDGQVGLILDVEDLMDRGTREG